MYTKLNWRVHCIISFLTIIILIMKILNPCTRALLYTEKCEIKKNTD